MLGVDSWLFSALPSWLRVVRLSAIRSRFGGSSNFPIGDIVPQQEKTRVSSWRSLYRLRLRWYYFRAGRGCQGGDISIPRCTSSASVLAKSSVSGRPRAFHASRPPFRM